ncbi:hypothetical protein AVEN_127196-1 [Araneus ventricosus]|uniref:Uncharacterized protein n=1 Tax=Araneus ventricosus TaxID=182803 RepID=A0A4Y2LTR5_ARAVE|nr:hypothetical protein AVEN_127196-1 [Araneus ventricosus]
MRYRITYSTYRLRSNVEIIYDRGSPICGTRTPGVCEELVGGQENSSMIDSTLYDNSLETITSNTGTMDIDNSPESGKKNRFIIELQLSEVRLYESRIIRIDFG